MPRKKKEVTRDYRTDTIKNPTEDQLKEAMEEASKLVKVCENDPKNIDRSPHKILPGVGKSTGELILSICALRMTGLRDVDIAKQLNTYQPRISQLETEHPEAFLKAKIIAMDNFTVDFEMNLWRVRAALSDAGPRLVNVLIEIAENKELKENVRKDAAIAGLNLLGMGSFRTTKGGKDSEITKGAATVFIQNTVSGGDYDDCRVIDAEDADFREDNS